MDFETLMGVLPFIIIYFIVKQLGARRLRKEQEDHNWQQQLAYWKELERKEQQRQKFNELYGSGDTNDYDI